MNTSLLVIIVGAVLALVAVLFVVGTYNKLVGLRNRFKNADAPIDVQLKRRYDLIPNLVEIAKGYLQPERGTLEAVIAARNTAFNASKAAAANPADAGAMKGLVGAEGGLAGAMSRLMVVVEQYPDLKANQNMMQLTAELSSTENKAAFPRQSYNDAVMAFTTQREVFPSSVIAGTFHVTAAALFVIEQAEERWCRIAASCSQRWPTSAAATPAKSKRLSWRERPIYG